ncbi:MAG: thermonuclease family protein, partial [Promethearchaeota archaeon]
ACFLNFHKNWKRYFTAVIFASDFHKFPPNPEDYYLNKGVKVYGLIKEYQGKPEIILKSPEQIKVIKED